MKMDCPWHGITEATYVKEDVYACAACKRHQEQIASVDVDEEVHLDKPTPAMVSKIQKVGRVRISLTPMDRAVMYWTCCEDVQAGDIIILVPARDGRSSINIQRLCRPLHVINREEDIRRAFGIALEDKQKGEEVPIHVLSWLSPAEGKERWIECQNGELVEYVKDEKES